MVVYISKGLSFGNNLHHVLVLLGYICMSRNLGKGYGRKILRFVCFVIYSCSRDEKTGVNFIILFISIFFTDLIGNKLNVRKLKNWSYGNSKKFMCHLFRNFRRFINKVGADD